jgi:hypothetical protein
MQWSAGHEQGMVLFSMLDSHIIFQRGVMGTGRQFVSGGRKTVS